MNGLKNIPLVSIIVPVYNVQLYVEKCIESLIRQTYHHIEIILVNDGSTDKSVEICERYVQKDNRIKIIHQDNKGLSTARNIGIDNCRGEYIMFVDSDDWVAEKMIEILLLDIEQYQLKLSMSDYLKVTIDSFKEPKSLLNNVTTVFKKEQAIKKMLLGEWWSAWAKLYHNSIFNNLRFPVGRTNEDYAIMVKVFEQCEYISFNKNKLYSYLTRAESICTSNLNTRKFDEIENAVDVLAYVKENHSQFEKEASYNLGASLIKLILAIYEDKSGDFDYLLPKFKYILKENFGKLKVNPFMPLQQKIFLYSVHLFGKRFNIILVKVYNFYNRLRK